jgi:LmbE family N-acetylglucosaminyl deacetylase
MVSVIALGCHPDDVESGCFGTLALYRKKNAKVKVLLLTDGELGGDREVRLKAALQACQSIGASLATASFKDSQVKDNAETVSWIEKEIRNTDAETVFAPCPHDRHQDHRNGGNAAISAAREVANVLLYETPTTVGFEPQMYVDISRTLEAKVEAMALHKPPEEQAIVSDAVRCLARFRAYQMRRLGGGAVEAFQVVKWKLDPCI